MSYSTIGAIGIGAGGAGGAIGVTGQAGYYAIDYNDTASQSGTITAGDVIIDGVSLKDSITKINERLLILVPDPAKMEKYEALKLAYDHYRTLEALIGDDTNTPVVK